MTIAMKKKAGVAAAMMLLSSAAAWAQAPGQPQPWQIDFQPSASPIMESIAWFEDYTLWFITPITLFVLGLLAWCVVRYRESANPTPSRTSHNTLIEVIWTVGPVLVLLCIAIPSFQLLTAQYAPPEEPTITLKATGNQWNWDYEYQLETPISFNSAILTDAARSEAGKEDLAEYPRLLAVDNEIVLPVNATIRLLATGGDVIHSFALPAFGVKVDAVPGRINEMWFRADREGMYYGQCSENCGKDHAFMPIAIRIVNQEQYNTWIAAAATDVGGANRALMASIEAQNKIASAGE